VLPDPRHPGKHHHCRVRAAQRFGQFNICHQFSPKVKGGERQKVLLLSLSSDQNDQRINLSDIIYDHHKIPGKHHQDKIAIDVLSVKFDASNAAI